MLPEVEPAPPHRVLQRRQRGQLDELRNPPIRRRHRHRPEGGRIPCPPHEEVVAQDDPAADEVADIEVEKIARPRALPEDKLRPAGRRGVVLQVDRIAAHRLEFGLHVHRAPGVHRIARQADDAAPLPDLERHGDAEPRDPPRGRGPEVLRLPDHGIGGEAQDLGGHGILVGQPGPCHDRAHEIGQHQFRTAPPDLQPEEEGPVRGEGDRHRGLPHLAPHRLSLAQQPLGLECAHDDRDGLRRQPGQPGDPRLGQRPVLADDGQDEPFVMVADTDQVRTAQENAARSVLFRIDRMPIHGRPPLDGP
jgi:hypothetical protein